MERVEKYLRILKFKKDYYKKIKKKPILKYNFFRIQIFFKKLNKIKFNFKKKFLSEIKEMVFGFGDSFYPDKDTIQFIENLIVKFVSITMVKANFFSFLRLSKRPVFRDILFIIRKDPSKTRRILYLIKMKEIIEKLVKETKNSNQIPKDIISKCKKPF